MNYKFLCLLIFSVLFISCSSDKESITESKQNIELDPALYGTWNLSKITTISGNNILLSPGLKGPSYSIKFNSDGTFESTKIESDEITIVNCTWGVSDGIFKTTVNSGSKNINKS